MDLNATAQQQANPAAAATQSPINVLFPCAAVPGGIIMP